MRITLTAILLAFALCPTTWAQNSQITLKIAPNRDDASYAKGETVIWNVLLSGTKAGEPAPSPGYVVTSGSTEISSGTLNFVDGKASVTAAMNQPGVMVLLINQKNSWVPNFRCGVVVALDEIKSTVAEPADFDQFWNDKLKELANVPMNPLLEEVTDSGDPAIQLWKITMDGVRGTKIYGYIARPKGSNPLPAQLQLQYWGVYPLEKKEVVKIAKQGWIAMNIMAHDLPCDRDKEFYKNPGINTYVNTGAEDRDKSYFLRMFLSCSRSVDYLAGRKDWNKGALIVHGGSQGGFQGIATAALNPKVTALTVFVPGGGNLTGFLDKQPSGWPGWVYSKAQGDQREAMIRAAGYYDTNNFAKRIKCPVLVGTGLIDVISKPETQFTMFNNITSPKRIVIMPADDHTAGHGAYKTVQAEWCKAAATGAPLTLK